MLTSIDGKKSFPHNHLHADKMDLDERAEKPVGHAPEVRRIPSHHKAHGYETPQSTPRYVEAGDRLSDEFDE